MASIGFHSGRSLHGRDFGLAQTYLLKTAKKVVGLEGYLHDRGKAQ